MSRLCFLSAPFPGVLRWLESGRDEGFWDLVVLDSESVEVPSREVYGFGAWSMGYRDAFLNLQRSGARVGVAWSSSPQESDAARSQVELLYLMALTDVKNEVVPDWWACLHPDLVSVLPGAVHLPAPVHLESVPNGDSRDSIGFYSPGTEKKAVFSQLLAVRAFQRRHPGVKLLTNLRAYEGVMRWLGIDFELDGWLSRVDLLRRLASCRFVMHASLAESFGYGAVDAMMAGAYVVGSPALSWLPRQWKALDANAPSRLVKIMDHLWGGVPEDPRLYIRDVARRQNRVVSQAVEAIVSGAVQKA